MSKEGHFISIDSISPKIDRKWQRRDAVAPTPSQVTAVIDAQLSLQAPGEIDWLIRTKSNHTGRLQTLNISVCVTHSASVSTCLSER